MHLQGLLASGLLLLAWTVQADDLLTVYRQTEQTSPRLAAAAADLNATRERRPQAFAGLLPVLSADGALDRQRFKELNGSDNTTLNTSRLANLTLTQPLFHYDRWIQLEQADSEIAAAEADYAAVAQEVMIQVAERYFTVLGAEDKLAFANAEKEAIGRQLEQAKQRYNVGLIAITDVKAAQARYDLSISREIQAHSELAQARDALRETSGTLHDALAPLQTELELVRPDPESPKQWLAQARKQNLRILSARAATEAARQEIRRQRAGHLPTLDLNAATRYIDTEFGGIAPIKRHDSEVGLQLTIPLYQGGLVNSRTREARSRFEEAKRNLQQAQRSAEFETRNAFRGVITDIAQVQALGESLASTEVAVRAEEAGFKVGTRTIVDVLNAQRENYLARLNYARARYQYLLDRLRLKQAIGSLSQSDLADINRHLETEAVRVKPVKNP